MLNNLTNKEIYQQNPKLEKLYENLQEVIVALNEKEVPKDMEAEFNEEINGVNAMNGNVKEHRYTLKRVRQKIISKAANQLKLVVPGYYRTLWMSVGMTAFGLPIGILIGLWVNNIGLLGVGLPLGFAIGMLIGVKLDKKAKAEGRQLAVNNL